MTGQTSTCVPPTVANVLGILRRMRAKLATQVQTTGVQTQLFLIEAEVARLEAYYAIGPADDTAGAHACDNCRMRPSVVYMMGRNLCAGCAS